MMIEKELFGYLTDERPVTLYRIRNKWGEMAELLDYGAVIHGIFVHDSSGRLVDVTLGVPDAKELEGFSFAGITIGRVANRIAFGRYDWEGKTVQLEQNWKGHFMHGASGNYAHRFFKVEPEGENTLKMFLDDCGDGGFGCKAEVEVDFSFDDEHRLTIDYTVTAGGDTLLCPTNHVYFNLSGTGREILNHQLQVYTELYAPVGVNNMPEGRIASVEGTPMDFRVPRTIGEALETRQEVFFRHPQPQFDDTFLLTIPGSERKLFCAAVLKNPDNGICMGVYTDMPAMVMFTPFIKETRRGKAGLYYAGYGGIAFETQFVPNAVNCTSYDIPFFRKGETLKSRTSYAFCDKSYLQYYSVISANREN